ncbi:MAG: DUF1517 domain-containing protein [Microcoleus sp. SIO2G3]|nr:DUF1517 domain-containing protein [Microcoleus sp. SIO2G3]
MPRHVDVDIDIENEDEDYNPNQVAPNSSTAGSMSNTNSSSESNSDSNSSNLSESNSDINFSNSSNSNDSSDDFWSVVVGLGIIGFMLLGLSAGIVLLVYFILKQKKGRSAANEQDNGIVTVSTLQVVLLGTTQGLQSELSELTLTADTETTFGLLQLLQESALVLLRNSESWTHVLASSQTVQSREEAEVLFKKLSLQKRSKFSAETLTKVGGRVNRRDAVNSDRHEASTDYIVVTLLVGTADDKPLLGDVRSVETLKAALEKLGSMSSEYLMVFELLWSPQAEEHCLSYDDLLLYYTDMIQIV